MTKRMTRSYYVAVPSHLPFSTNYCEMCDAVWYLYDRGLERMNRDLSLHQLERITKTKALVLQLEGRPVKGSIDLWTDDYDTTEGSR